MIYFKSYEEYFGEKFKHSNSLIYGSFFPFRENSEHIVSDLMHFLVKRRCRILNNFKTSQKFIDFALDSKVPKLKNLNIIAILKKI